jgi:hypothetical protein
VFWHGQFARKKEGSWADGSSKANSASGDSDEASLEATIQAAIA